jgi:hypothetical protein
MRHRRKLKGGSINLGFAHNAGKQFFAVQHNQLLGCRFLATVFWLLSRMANRFTSSFSSWEEI